jgi:EmrB/QacA subfamily drug resistance transporter
MTTTAKANKGIILLLTCVAQFMVVLDVAIVNVALPSIQRDLHVGQSTLQWIVVAYGLMLGGFLLFGGRLADLLGRRRILLTGLTIFSIASLLAGLAGSAGFLIGARALQGFGAALIPPAALSIIAVTFGEGAERNRALGLYGATAGISASVGVIASGLLTDGPGWRSIFFINAPLGAVLIALAAILLTPDSPERRPSQRFDIAGAVTVTAGLLLLVYAISRSTSSGWTSGSTPALLASSAVLLCAFVGIESRARSPLIPGSVARQRTLVAANLSSFFLFGALFAFIFLGSLLMQQVLAYSPTHTGVAWLATTVTSFFAAGIAGAKLVGVVGVRRLQIGGFALFAGAALLLTRVPAEPHYATDLLPAFMLAGLGGGLSAPAIQIGALSGVSHSLTGLAGGLVETLREIGGGVGVAVVATVLASRAGDLARVGSTDTHRTAALGAFHTAFWVMFVAAGLGALTAALAFPRSSTREAGVHPHGPELGTEPA